MAYPDPKIVTVAAPTSTVNATRPLPSASAHSTARTQPCIVIRRGGQQLADLHRHTTLDGPAASEAERRLTEFGLLADGFAGNVITDEHRLARLMRRNDPAIYPGTYVTCVYRHDTALCRGSRNSSGTDLPELTDCKPLTCRNVALTPANITAWQTERDALDAHLARRPRLPPLLEHQLGRRRADIDDFLTHRTRMDQP